MWLILRRLPWRLGSAGAANAGSYPKNQGDSDKQSPIHYGMCSDLIFRTRESFSGNFYIIQRLARELRIWSKLVHPNILRLLGYTLGIEDGGYPAMITEWMVNGNVRVFLQIRPDYDILPLVRHSRLALLIDADDLRVS